MANLFNTNPQYFAEIHTATDRLLKEIPVPFETLKDANEFIDAIQKSPLYHSVQFCVAMRNNNKDFQPKEQIL